MDASTPDLETAVAEIRKAATAGDRNRAIDLAIAAMSRQLEHPIIFRWVAEGLEEDGRAFDALPLFNRAQHEAPDEVELKLVFAADMSTDDTSQPSLFTALQETLGLKLESQDVPVEMVVIDHVDREPTEN